MRCGWRGMWCPRRPACSPISRALVWICNGWMAAIIRRPGPSRISPDFSAAIWRAAHGAAIGAETRVDPDGTLDITDWPRPQHDGPALRALAILNWGVPGDAAAAPLASDLGFVLSHARQPCFGIWEEEKGLHYYTQLVSVAALVRGADWLATMDDTAMAALCRDEADRFSLR